MKTAKANALFSLAEFYADQGVYFPKVSSHRLLAKIRDLEGSRIGADWLDAIPEELSEHWDKLTTEAQLTAFIVAACHTSCGGTLSSCERDFGR